MLNDSVGFGQYDPAYKKEERERLARGKVEAGRQKEIRKFWGWRVEYWQKLGLSFRVANSLANAGIKNMKHLYEFEKLDCMKLRGIGKKAIKEINEVL